ncbi:hypothetical protein CHARACLAT_033626 [Characodon lateralis]|uniref:Uncharacterized protein n=1 Tax=Characodon lateralis TaxID=208331 RepID=A0ABU7E9X4_9TELE|nr:hypothetical protein [Characodon lateralis]
MLFLREKEEELLKEDYGEGNSMDELMKIVTMGGGSDPARAKIVLEGTEVLTDVDIPRACALLMGLIYALNLSYPKQLQKYI